MIIRAIKAVLTVDASQYEAAMRSAVGATQNLESATANVGKSGGPLKTLASNIRENSQAWDEVASKSMIAGAAIVGGLGLATGAAISWESAWAGVRKTVDGSDVEMAALEQELRELAKTLPATHEEIAGVAEAAGQLGIQRENVAEFTRTMIDMGEATNLTADEAATSFARFANIMGTSQDQMSNMGSAVVALGNNFATTEGEIVSMALRLAGAGRQANMTEGDIFGIAAAMSSVGIEAEAGGTAMSRVIIEIGKSVDTGSDKLETFARVAGMSVDAFSKLWSEDAGEALTRFVQGLGDVQEKGESLEPILSELGMTDIRVGDALRRSASASDDFRDAMDLANGAFEENVALQDEAAQRYETTESRLRIAGNNIKDSMIDVGAALAEPLAKVAEFGATMANAFSALPGPIKSGIGYLGAFTGGALLLAGAGIKAVRTAQDLGDAFSKIGIKGPGAAGGVDKVTGAAKNLGVALAALAVADALLGFEDLALGTDSLVNAMVAGKDAVAGINSAFSEAATLSGATDLGIKTLGDALRATFDPNMGHRIGNVVGSIRSLWMDENLSAMGVAEQRFKDLDAALTSMVTSGHGDRAAEVFAQIATEADKQGISVDELKGVLPEYAGALAAVENQALLTADASGELASESGELASGIDEAEQSAKEAAEAFKEMLNQLAILGGGLRAEQAAASGVRDALKDVAEAAKDGNKTWHEKEALLATVGEKYATLAAKQAENGKSQADLTATIREGRQAFIDAAKDLGYTSEAAEALADAYELIPDQVTTMIEAAGVVESTAEVIELDDSIRRLDGKTVTVEEEGANPSKGRVIELDGAIFNLSDKTVKVEEIGSTLSGERVVRLQDKIYRLTGKEVPIGAKDNASRTIDEVRRKIERLSGKTVTIGVNYVQRGQMSAFADGGVWDKAASLSHIRAFAHGDIFDGRIGDAWPQVRPYSGPRGVLWGEEGSGPWEAFISGHPAKRLRSRSIADEVVARLGGRIEWVATYASGGIRDAGEYRSYATVSTPAPVSPSIDYAQLAAAMARLAPEFGRAVEAGAYRGIREIGRGI